MKIALERWETFYPDCLPLLAEHHAELNEEDPRAPHDPDVAMIEKLDRWEILQIVSARDDGGNLVGYCGFDIGKSLESKNLLCGTLRPFFVTKKHRGSIGTKLFMRSIEELKLRGVKKAYIHHYLTGDSPKLQILFERLGAKPLQHEYSLWVGE